MANVRPVEELLKSFNDFMKNIDWKQQPDTLYAPVDYMMKLGGKRIRPLSLLVITEILNGPAEPAYQAAYGLELFHNFTLIHDDIMDNASIRRSKPTVHSGFGLNAAILSGDVMMIESMRFILKAEQLIQKKSLSELFIRTAKEICEGQAYDLAYEKTATVKYSDYLKMIRLKTSVLLGFAMQAASIIASKEALGESLYKAGILIGQAFQLEDDWLDLFSDNPSFGKIKGGDIIQGKKTAIIFELLECLNEHSKIDFIKWYEDEKDPQKRLAEVEAGINQYEIRSKLLDRIKQFQDQALRNLQELELEDHLKLQLTNFVQSVFKREV
jgi:geranylgeranyl diphosphate synthase type II